MAHAAGDAHDIPMYGAHCLVTFPILDADGDLVTGATGLDSEVSKDLGTMADCTNEATEIATSSGVYYLYLTGAEMTANIVTVIVKTTSSGAKTTVLTLYPKRMPVFESGVAQAGSSTTITLASGASTVDNFYNGMFVLITDNDAAGSQYQARNIISYVGSTRVATIESAWGTNPSSSSNYDILIPDTSRVAGNATFSSINNSGATTLTGNVSMAAGLNITQSSSNTSALVVTGNGTGHGIIATSGSGATGDGIKAVSVATNGNGVSCLATGSGSAILATSGGAAGNGVKIDGANGTAVTITTTSGSGLNITSLDGDAVVITAGNSSGLSASHGMKVTGSSGTSTTPAGHGVKLIGGASAALSGATAGNGLYVVGGEGSASLNGAAPGAYFVGGGTNTVASSASGIYAAGTSQGSGIQVLGSGSGSGLLADTISTSGAATFSTFNVTGATNFNGNLQVTGTTTLTGVVTASNAGNNIIGVSAVTLSPAGLDAVLVESGITAGASLTNDASTQLTSINARQALALCTSVLAGVLSGGGTATNTIKQAGKPSGNSRVVATVDSSGNRSALTLKVPT